MNNVLLIPGSFNPITNAHIEIAETARKAVDAYSVCFIPAHDTYVAKKKTLIPGPSRCRLIQEATPNYMTAITLEVDSFLPKKTYDTIQELREICSREYKFYNYYVCLGMDNISKLTSWYNWQPLVEENMFVACTRQGEKLNEALIKGHLEKYANHFIEIEIPENNISSSLVRQLCEQKKFDEVKKLVPENVYEYLWRFYDVLDRI